MPLTSPYTSRSSRISAPSGTPGNPSGRGVAYNGSSRTLGSPCMNAFSPSANVPSDVGDARICSVMLMDDSSGVWQVRSISWMSGSLKPCTHQLSLAFVTSICLLPAQDKSRGDHSVALFFSDHTRLHVESIIVTALKSSTPCHSVSIAFENCICSSAERCFQDTSSAFRRLEVKFSVQRARLGRRNRKGSVLFAFPDVEASSLLSCLLDVHRSCTFGRHPSSVSVTLHRHFVVSRRSFLGHAQVESLSSWIITCSNCYSPVGARTSLLRRNEKEQRIHLSQLVSAFSYAVPPSTPGPRMRPGDVSGNLFLLEIEPCDHRLQSPCQCRQKSRPRPRDPRGFLIPHCVMRRWEFASALSSSSSCESGLPKRTSHDIAFHDHGLIVLRITLASDVGEVSPASFTNCFSQVRQQWCNGFNSFGFFVFLGPHLCAIALMQAVPHVHPDSRFVQASVLYSRRTRQVPHRPWAPSFPSVYEDVYSSHQYLL